MSWRSWMLQIVRARSRSEDERPSLIVSELVSYLREEPENWILEGRGKAVLKSSFGESYIELYSNRWGAGILVNGKVFELRPSETELIADFFEDQAVQDEAEEQERLQKILQEDLAKRLDIPPII